MYLHNEFKDPQSRYLLFRNAVAASHEMFDCLFEGFFAVQAFVFLDTLNPRGQLDDMFNTFIRLVHISNCNDAVN